MSPWKWIQSNLAEEARLASALVPAAMAAARTFHSARNAQSQRLNLGRTTFSIEHDDRYRGYVLLALAGGAVLGAAGALFFAPQSGEATREQLANEAWARLRRIPTALTAARDAAQRAFHHALVDEPVPPS